MFNGENIMVITKHPSPNFNSDREINPAVIVIHWTASYFQSAIGWLCNPQAQVSAHFVIDADGKRVFQLVDLNRRAWHCNPSWHPLLDESVKGLNSYSIGIECEGPPSSIKRTGWSDDFIFSLSELCIYIASECGAICGITDHSTICPQQKNDVLNGKGIDAFPWQKFISMTGMINLATPEIREEVRKHYGMV